MFVRLGPLPQRRTRPKPLLLRRKEARMPRRAKPQPLMEQQLPKVMELRAKRLARRKTRRTPRSLPSKRDSASVRKRRPKRMSSSRILMTGARTSSEICLSTGLSATRSCVSRSSTSM